MEHAARTGQQAVASGAYKTAVYLLKQAVALDPSGHPRNIKVIRSLGLELDEKAVETASL